MVQTIASVYTSHYVAEPCRVSRVRLFFACPVPSCTDRILAAVESTRIDVLSGAVSKLNVRHARAGSKKDEAGSISMDIMK